MVVSSGTGWAQVGGGISGKVEDETGAPVAGVTVKVKSLETGASRAVTADEAGSCRFPSLPLGSQEVSRGEERIQGRCPDRDPSRVGSGSSGASAARGGPGLSDRDGLPRGPACEHHDGFHFGIGE